MTKSVKGIELEFVSARPENFLLFVIELLQGQIDVERAGVQEYAAVVTFSAKVQRTEKFGMCLSCCRSEERRHQRRWYRQRKCVFILSFPLTTTMVKSNIQNKFYATNACPPGPQATPTSVGESLDSLNLISRASSRAGKYIYPRGCSRACCTIRRSFRSVSAAEDSRKASSEPSSSSEEEKSEEEEVNPGPRTPTASRIITSKFFHRIVPFQLPTAPSPSAPKGRTHFMS